MVLNCPPFPPASHNHHIINFKETKHLNCEYHRETLLLTFENVVYDLNERRN